MRQALTTWPGQTRRETTSAPASRQNAVSTLIRGRSQRSRLDRPPIRAKSPRHAIDAPQHRIAMRRSLVRLMPEDHGNDVADRRPPIADAQYLAPVYRGPVISDWSSVRGMKPLSSFRVLWRGVPSRTPMGRCGRPVVFLAKSLWAGAYFGVTFASPSAEPEGVTLMPGSTFGG